MYKNTFFKNSQNVVLTFEDKKELQDSSCSNKNRVVKILIKLKIYMNNSNNSPDSGKKGKK